MKRLFCLILASVMLASLCNVCLGEAGKGTDSFSVIEADGNQKRLTYIAEITPILEIDGLKFKDMDKDGELDAYEDWRLDDASRATDLVVKLSVSEKAAMLFMANISGRPDDLDPDTFVLTEENQDYLYMKEFGISHFLDNANGTPAQQVVHHNALQAYGEATPFGIPITLASDREYNTWGGMVDAMHPAYGTAYDSELVAKITGMQALEMKALKYQVVFHPSAVELGDSYGETPSYVAEVVGKEIAAIQGAGIEATAKHFIAKPFYSSISPAESLENWLIPWRAAVDSGVGWVMTNNQGLGLSGQTLTDFDSYTISVLRDELGYTGVIITDWGSFGSHSPTGHASGVTLEGVNLDDYQLDAGMLYTCMLTAGVDMFGSGTLLHGTQMESSGSPNLPEALVAAVESGICDEKLLDRSAERVLVSKFKTGMFEDPYANLDEVLSLAASEAYIAEPWPIENNADLSRARNPELVALEEQLEIEAVVLLKNDGGLLPLSAGTKIYLEGTNAKVAEKYRTYLAEDCVIVEEIAEANVVIVDADTINDASELYMEDAIEAGKPLVVTLESISPNEWITINADAVVYNAVKRTPDHGSAMSHDFSNYIDPWIYADLITGKAQPGGRLVKAVPRTTEQDTEDWGDIANDFGANDYVRLIIAALQLENPNDVPINYGDPLFCTEYGMSYGSKSDIEYRTLTLPIQYERTETSTNFGTFVWVQVFITESHNVKAGEAFKVYCLVFNHGADDVEIVNVYDGETLLAQKAIAVNGGSWRVAEMEITLEGLGEHTITIGGMTGTVVVTE